MLHTNTLPTRIIASMVYDILNGPFLPGRWTVQGFGMFQLYIDTPKTELMAVDSVRLDLWDSAFRIPDVSDIHSHPWNFESMVVAGRLKNHRYHALPEPNQPTHQRVTIKCGAGAMVKSVPSYVALIASGPQVLYAGESYGQLYNEVHKTEYTDGTVTLCHRYLVSGDVDHAYSFYEVGKEWVSAEPRAATEEEVRSACAKALARF